MKVWFNKSGNIKLRVFLFLVVCLLLFIHKNIRTSDHKETIGSCRYKFFLFNFIDTCENVQSLIIELTIDHYSVWKLKYQNLNLFSHMLLLFTGNVNINPGFVPQDTLQCSNEWNIFKNRGLYFIHLSINSLLPKIAELRYITKSTNAVIIGICESKLNTSVLDPDISFDYCKICLCDRSRQGGGVACYVRNYLL